VFAERMDGQILSFTQNGSIWTTDSDIDIYLTQSGTTWTLTNRDDSIETYAVSPTTGLGTLMSIRLRNGYTQDLTYDPSSSYVGKPLSVTDTYGRALTFTYANGLLQTVATPDGQVFTYGFTSVAGANVLTSVTYSTTPATNQQYLYENNSFPFALTGVIDENGSRYATWTYDSTGRGLTSQHGGGVDLTTFSYDDVTGNRTVTNALGQQTLYKYAKMQGVPKVVEIDRLATATTAAATQTFTYDANGYLASATDWNGNRTTYVNDSHGRTTVLTEAVGTAQSRATTTRYHATYHLPLSITTSGVTTTFTYDVSGNLLTKTDSDTTKQSVPYATINTARTTKYTWSNSLLASQQGPRTDAKELTAYTYDSTGTLTATTNALNQVAKVTSHMPGGLPLTMVDANGVTTTLSYDARLRLVSRTVNIASGPLTTLYAYDAAGNLVRVTQPDGSSVINIYDDAHRLIQTNDLLNETTQYGLDNLGNRIFTIVRDASGVQQRRHTSTFDALGRLLTDRGGSGQVTTYGYDSSGNATTITDPLNHLTTQAFDALNRRTQIKDALGGITATTYDLHDRPLTIKDARGNTTSYVYDGFGNRIQQVSPDTGTTVYRYDLASNLTQKSDAAGAVVKNTYDALDRVTTTTYSTSTSDNVTYRYDEASGGFGTGRLTTVVDGAGLLQRVYDERGNPVSETRILPTGTRHTSYGWDKANHLASIAYPSGWSISYSRDVVGQVTGISALAPGATGPPQTLLSNITYKPFGPATSLTYGNDVAESLYYDLDYRLTILLDAGRLPIQNLRYSYDAANNVVALDDGVRTGYSQTFAYDAINQLTGATGIYGNLGYTYDALGNRLTATTASGMTTYSYQSSNNRLASLAAGGVTTTVGYTATGNINSQASPGVSWTYTYSDAGRLTVARANGLQMGQYTYDAFGHRLLKQGSSLSSFQYDLSGHLLEQTDFIGAALVDYVYLGDRPVATLSPQDSKVYFLHDDRSGTPQVATDANQTIQWSANYQPFGETSTGIGLIVQNLRLPGQEYDSETGLYHNGFRDYAAGWGRYIESDPISILGGPAASFRAKFYNTQTGRSISEDDAIGLGGGDVNLYRYTANNPVGLNDPLGLESVLPVRHPLLYGLVTVLGTLEIIPEVAVVAVHGWEALQIEREGRAYLESNRDRQQSIASDTNGEVDLPYYPDPTRHLAILRSCDRNR